MTNPRRPRIWWPWLALLMLAAACAGRAPEEPRPGALSRIVDTGKLRVGMSGEQPPLNMTTRNGDLIGLEVALMRVLARSMGVEAVIVQTKFGKLLEALEAGEVDLVMSGMTITPERSRRVSFVGPYFISGKTLLTRSERLAGVQIPEDLDSPDLRFAALRGSTSEEFARSALSRAELVVTGRLEEAIQLVIDEKVDALVADRETCHFAVLRNPDAGLLTSSATFTLEPLGIAVRQDERQLVNLVRTYLEALEEKGVLESTRNFWFKDPSWVEDLR